MNAHASRVLRRLYPIIEQAKLRGEIDDALCAEIHHAIYSKTCSNCGKKHMPNRHAVCPDCRMYRAQKAEAMANYKGG